MAEANADSRFDQDAYLLLTSDEWPLKWQRRLHLVPREGMGLGRRAILYALVAWVPLAVWAYLHGRALPGGSAEPLMAHFGVNVRCLVAIPLLILAEGTMGRMMASLASQFVRNGLVTEAQRGAFVAELQRTARLRDSSLPWIVMLGVIAAWIFVAPPDTEIDALSWSIENGSLGFGGWWFAYVARPIFLALMLSWLWRIALVVGLFRRIAKLDLALVPSHPDRAGGLGFLETFPGAFVLVTFAVSAVIGSGWAHDLVYHGVKTDSILQPLAAFAVVWSLVLLSPLLMFAPKLIAAKRQAKIEYGRLVGQQGRAVRQRWVVGDAGADEEALEPAGVGPVADATSLYESVTAMRPVPIGKVALFSVLVPLAIPMLAVFSIQIPIKTLLGQLLKVLV